MAVSVPHVAAIEHPFGMTVGNPGDKEDQLNVLHETLKAVEEMKEPGSIKHLPLEWNAIVKESETHPPVPPPIATYLMKHPLQLPKLISRKV